jgi:hypothetical protein
VHSIDALQMHAKPQHDSHQLRVVVLLTDGDDTCSEQHTLDSVIQRVHSCSIANFHLMLLGVAVDAAKYAPLFAPDKPNLHFIDVHDATADAIQDAFDTVSTKITALQQKLIVRNNDNDNDDKRCSRSRCPPTSHEAVFRAIVAVTYSNHSALSRAEQLKR